MEGPFGFLGGAERSHWMPFGELCASSPEGATGLICDWGRNGGIALPALGPVGMFVLSDRGEVFGPFGVAAGAEPGGPPGVTARTGVV